MRRWHMIIGLVAIVAPLFAFLLAREEPASGDSEEPPGTQIVVQWLDSGPMDSSTRIEPMLDLLHGLSENLYVVDSFDLGGGTANVFLYSADPEAATRRVIQLFDDGLLPPGMRIGVATSRADPASRTYRPVYPAELKDFRLIYPRTDNVPNAGG